MSKNYFPEDYFPFLQLKKTVHSAVDNTIKYIFTRRSGEVLEFSYINKNDGKNIICVPCQCMCNLKCKFCQASDFIGKIKPSSLMAVEIWEGVYYIYQDLFLDKEPKTLLVSYMGMGDPILNYNGVVDSMNLIKFEYRNIPVRFAFATSLPKVFNVDFFKMTEKIKNTELNVKLHISLHYTDNDIRKEWMPASLDIESTIAAANFYKINTGNPVEIHYALIKDINDSSSDADELASLLQGTGFNVKFLLYNEKKSVDAHASDIEKFKMFRCVLDTVGIDSEYYIPPGLDVGASCGQFMLEEYV